MTDVLTPRPGATQERAERATVLGPRALNRALLHRQLLLERHDLSAGAALEHLVGMPSQNPSAPYVGLWSRLIDFEPDELASLVQARKVVRLALMRWTLHAVTSADCVALRPVLQPVMERRMQACFGRHLQGVDLARLADRGRELVEQEPLSLGDIGRLLAADWPGREPRVLGNALAAVVPLVHIPPRGIWGRNGRAVQTTAERWLGRPLARDSAPDDLVRRYLAAYGPATIADIKAWSGLTGLGAVIARLRPELRSFRDERGRELLDVADGALPDPETPAPPRFLPDFDSTTLAHADRSRIVGLGSQRRSLSPKTFLVDGFVRGSWRLIRGRSAVTLEVTPVVPLRADARGALAEEGMRLLSFLTADADGDARVSVHFVTD